LLLGWLIVKDDAFDSSLQQHYRLNCVQQVAHLFPSPDPLPCMDLDIPLEPVEVIFDAGQLRPGVQPYNQ
jgi:hypothetical protein